MPGYYRLKDGGIISKQYPCLYLDAKFMTLDAVEGEWWSVVTAAAVARGQWSRGRVLVGVLVG